MEEVGVSAASTSITASESTLNGDLNEENKNEIMEVEDSSDCEEIPRISVEGIEDDSEETMIMTVEEAKDYILKKVLEYMKDSKVNPLLVHQNEILDYHKKIQQKNEEFNKLSKVFEVLYREQVKFLRHIGVMSKADTKTVGVGVDLPWISDSVGGVDIKQENMQAGTSSVASSSVLKLPKKKPSGPVECIDLSSDEDEPKSKPEPKAQNTNLKPVPAAVPSTPVAPSTLSFPFSFKPKHPAPLPSAPVYLGKPTDIPPKPSLKISVESKGIILQWDMPTHAKRTCLIKNFEIFGYQEKPEVEPATSLWKKIGTVEYMTLPMSCTLTQFIEGYRYHFSIRAIAPPEIYGVFSDPATITFKC